MEGAQEELGRTREVADLREHHSTTVGDDLERGDREE